jgi:putative endonuclease
MIDTFNPDWRDLYDELRLEGLKDAADWVLAFAGMSGELE